MVHNPKHKVHSFRGLLADGGEDEINLERQNVNIAYRIVKFEILGNIPGAVSYECVVKIYKEKQTSIDATIDFSDVNLLGAAYVAVSSSGWYASPMDVTFDNTLFSRNIFVTNSDVDVGQSCNYYIEIEEVPVTAATLMQLKLQVARKLSLQQD